MFLVDIKNLWQAVADSVSNLIILDDKLQLSARKAADASYELVMGMYRYCGMNTVFSQNELSKIVRDFLVATQHFSISPLQSLPNKEWLSNYCVTSISVTSIIVEVSLRSNNNYLEKLVFQILLCPLESWCCLLQ